MIYAAFNGRLTRNPEQGQTQRGSQYVAFNLATDSTRQDQQGNHLTTFVRVTVWGRRSEFVLNHFMKGDPIYVAGELVMTSYQNREGQERQSLEMTADNISFVPQVPNRNQRPQQAPQGGQNTQQGNYQQQPQNGQQGYQGQNNNYSQGNGYAQGNGPVQVDDDNLPF